MPRAGVQNAAACTARVSMLIVCSGAMLAIAAMISRGENARPLGHDRGRPHGFGDRIDAADAAAGRARDMPPPLVERSALRRCQPHPQLDAVVEFDDIERVDLVRRLHDAFAEAEADRQSPAGSAACPSSRRRCRHYRSARCAVSSGIRRVPSPRLTVAPDLPIDGMDRAGHALTPRLPPARCGGSDGPARHRPSASRTDRSTARSAPP